MYVDSQSKRAYAAVIRTVECVEIDSRVFFSPISPKHMIVKNEQYFWYGEVPSHDQRTQQIVERIIACLAYWNYHIIHLYFEHQLSLSSCSDSQLQS